MRFSFRKWLEQNDPNPHIRWNSDIPTYHKGLVKANALHPGYVSVYDPEHYSREGRKRRVFHDPDGDVGYSLLPHWGDEDHEGLYLPHESGRTEIAGVYNHGDHRKKGWGTHAIQHGARQGGNYLEAFEGNDRFSLPLYYQRHLGVQPVGYMPWDDKYKPDGWDYEKSGRPGIVQMEIPKHGMADVDRWLAQRHGDDPRSFAEFQERLRHFKRLAGVKMEENKKHDTKKHKDHSCSHEEAKRLADGVDEYYFGAQNQSPEVILQPTESVVKSLHAKPHPAK
jgi:hypothetical protein